MLAFVTQAALFTSSVLVLALAVTGLTVLTLVFVFSAYVRKDVPSEEDEYARASAERWGEEKLGVSTTPS